MPAAAVIPAPIAYLNVVAVKKLVVEFLAEEGLYDSSFPQVIRSEKIDGVLSLLFRISQFTLKKLECFRQAFA